jgi:hypothetical protein
MKNCEYILNVAVPDFYNPVNDYPFTMEKYKEGLIKTYVNIFKAAQDLKSESVALPLLGL